MNDRESKTILLGVVLAVLVVPVGGTAAPYALILIVALVAFDLWQQRRHG